MSTAARVDDPATADCVRRLRRIEGQTRGLQTMVTEDRSCGEVLQQVAAVEAALRQVAVLVARQQVERAFELGDDPPRRAQMADELMASLAQLVR